MKPKRQKTGGRQKGTPNKVTQSTREFLQAVFDGNKHFIEKAFTDTWATDGEKLELLLKILPFVCAKPMEISLEHEYRRLALLLESSPEQYIDEISRRVLQLHEQSAKNGGADE